MNPPPNKPTHEREFWGRPVIVLDKASLKEPSARQRVNPQMIVLARELRGLTQADLAAQIDATQGKISKIEDGFLSVSADDLQQMILALNLPRAFFFRQDVKRTVFNSFYICRHSTPKKLLTQLNARVCLRKARLERLLRGLELVKTPEIPNCDPDAYPGGPRQIALLARQSFGLPPGPVRNLIPALEDAGFVIVLEDFGIPKLDALSVFTESRTPVIFFNAILEPSRRKLALVHELAHVIMHRLPRPDAEAEAQQFAAEFLLPEADLAADFNTPGIDALVQLKLKWGVPLETLIQRAETLRLIPDIEAAGLRGESGERGYRVQEPHEDLLQEAQPSLERKLIETHLNELGYTRAGVLEHLDMDRLELETILQVEKNNPLRAD